MNQDEDFMQWSGGFTREECSPEQIAQYEEYAAPAANAPTEHTDRPLVVAKLMLCVQNAIDEAEDGDEDMTAEDIECYKDLFTRLQGITDITSAEANNIMCEAIELISIYG